MIVGADGKPLQTENEWEKGKTEQLKTFIGDMPKGTHHLAMGVKENGLDNMYFAMTGRPEALYLNFLDCLYSQYPDVEMLSMLAEFKTITEATIEYVEKVKTELVN